MSQATSDFSQYKTAAAVETGSPVPITQLHTSVLVADHLRQLGWTAAMTAFRVSEKEIQKYIMEKVEQIILKY